MEGKRRKKIFTITDIGKSSFSIWVAQPMQAEKVKNMELSKLFFAGLAKPEERSAAIKNYICQMQHTKSVLCAIQEHFRQMKVKKLPPETDWTQVLRFQGYTIEYGTAAAEFEISWYSQLLRKLEEQP